MIPKAMIRSVRTALRELALTDLMAWDRFSLNCILRSFRLAEIKIVSIVERGSQAIV
jgi:hypothetical protein